MIKKIVIIFAILFFFYNCKNEAKKNIDKKEIKKEIQTFLDDWHQDASATNFEEYFAAMAENSIFIGTDATENWNKKEFMEFSKPYFDKGKAWSFTPLERNIYINSLGNLVWFDELLNTSMGICRGSGVIEKQNNNWKIRHYVLSMTIPNEKAKPIINIKKHKDSLTIKTIILNNQK